MFLRTLKSISKTTGHKKIAIYVYNINASNHLYRTMPHKTPEFLNMKISFKKTFCKKFIYVVHSIYTKSLSSLSSAALDPTDRSENQKWPFKRQQQIDCFDKSNL